MSSNPPILLHVGWHAPARGWHMPVHSHTSHEWVILTGGSERVRLADRVVEATAGDVLCFGPGVSHEEWAAGHEPLRSHFITFQIEPGRASAWPRRCVDVEGRLRMLAGWMHALRETSQPSALAAQQAFFLALLSEFDRLIGQQEDALVSHTRAHVRQNLAGNLTLAGLARQAGLSKYHFVRRYRQLAGRTPMADVRSLRLARARDLLLTGSLPIKAIAPLCGFSGEVALYRLFRQHYGTTPGRLRASARL